MSTASTPRSPLPNVAPWRAWQGWAALIIGVYVLLAPIWTSDASGVWFITLGIVIALIALWQLGSALSTASNWVQVAAGVASFVAPWLGGFSSSTAASWTLWIAAVALIAVSVIALTNTSRQDA